MRYIVVFLLGLFWQISFAQETPVTKEVKIKTSAQCDMCKKRIEKAIGTQKGVKSASLDVESKVLTVVYKTDKTDVNNIKTMLTRTGYDADEMTADKKAHDKLPACCQKTGGHNNSH